MRINIITEDREKYMDILLLADPQEDMILKYLHQSDLFVLSEEGVIKTVCAVVRLNDRACEIKNIATIEDERGKGYGTHMIHYVCVQQPVSDDIRGNRQFEEHCGVL